MRKAQVQATRGLTNDESSKHGTDVDDGEELGDVGAKLTAVKGKKQSRVAAMDKEGSQ
jgi:hypothetical protein